MEAAPVKELTKGILEQLSESCAKDENAKVSGFLQVLDIRDDLSKIVLSDGYSSADYALFKSVRSKLTENKVKKFDVLQVSILKHKGKLLVVVDLSPLYQDVGVEIGKPILNDVFVTNGGSNPAGDCRIPARCYAKLMPTGPQPVQGGGKVDEENGEEGSDDFTPLSLLTPGSNSWVVKARVVSKSDLRQYGGQEGKKAGCLFDCVLADKSCRVQCTFFNEAAQKYDQLLEVGRVYEFQNGEVKKAGNFNKTSSSVEITFGSKSIITVAKNEGGPPKDIYEFTKLKDIKSKEGNSYVDVLVLLREINPPEEFKTRAGETRMRQILKVVDDSGFESTITFWGEDCKEDLKRLRLGEAVIFTYVRISEFNGGKDLAGSKSTKIITTLPESSRVREFIVWRNQNTSKLNQGTLQFETLKESKEYKETHVLTIKELKDLKNIFEADELEELKLSFLLHGWVSMLPLGADPNGDRKGNPYHYDKCPNEKCFKKATKDESNPEVSECNNCGVIRKPVVPRYIGNMRIQDCTDDLFLKFSSDFVGESLYGKTCKDLRQLEELDRQAFIDHVHGRYRKEFYFRVGGKRDTYNGEIRITWSIYSVIAVTSKSAPSLTKNLLKTIKHMQTLSELQ